MSRKLSTVLKLFVPALLLLCTTILLVQVALNALYQEKQDKLSAISVILQHRLSTDPSITNAMAYANQPVLYQQIQNLLDETFPADSDLSGSLYIAQTHQVVAYAPHHNNEALPFKLPGDLQPAELLATIETGKPHFYYTVSVMRGTRIYNYATAVYQAGNVLGVLSVSQTANSIQMQETAIWLSGSAICLIALTLLLAIGVSTYRKEQHLQLEQNNLINWLKSYDGDTLSVNTMNSQLDLLKNLPHAFKDAVDLVHHYRRQQRHALDQLPLGLLTLDATGRVLYTNPFFSQMFGYSGEEVLSWDGTRWQQVYRMLDGTYVSNELRKGRRIENRIGLFRHKNGEEIPFSLTMRELPPVQAQPAGWLLICYDLSKEFTIDRLTQKTQVLLQSVALNVLLLDANQRIEYISPELCTLVGCHESDVVGQHLADAMLWQLPDREHALHEALQKVLANGRRDHLPQGPALLQGREYLLEYDLFPILNPLTQDADGCMIFVKDTTLYQEWEQLSRRVDAHSNYVQMAATIAHEVRNPMTSVRGFLQLLAKDLKGDVQQMYLHVMQTEIDRMNAILTEYLSMARPVQELEWEPIDLASLIRETFLVLEGEANYRGVLLELNLEETHSIEGNARELKQVLINLVRNAFDAIEGPSGRIEIRLRNGVIEVADNGCGMTLEQIERIFEPFFTTKATGTGLGLPVCRKIVETHRGTLEVMSAVEVGTVFTIRF
ncbi:ATP-binding protein [Tumebacillus permanentifrigoris]|uniref:histidine kinase n=1 Tax=Tumebacillus permanentifrigoris TaxID=378543 RepID=A0A316D5B3_9BACL|nr:ATP-binding protein [Tumebacillus permanentifrigoris]PWK05964.1 PAS domain S-box-containing protein [Tumebacillus permanentifrigoris]